MGKAENKDGYLKVDQVEKLVEGEVKKRESAVKERLEDAKNKAKSGDNQTAIQEYRTVLEQKCLFPGKAKDAAKALKKLGVTDVRADFRWAGLRSAAQREDRSHHARRPAAENAAKYTEAERLYAKAHQMDPADPAPLRYLGEALSASHRASGIRRGKRSTRFWLCPPIRCRGLLRCTDWAR